jgi:hypothetical protein
MHAQYFTILAFVQQSVRYTQGIKWDSICEVGHTNTLLTSRTGIAVQQNQIRYLSNFAQLI